MCGIAGLLRPGGATNRDVEDALAMSAAVARRGPDDNGMWVDEHAGVVLAHRRLAIVDLSHEGHQPMVSSDGRWVVVFNGEVYDHQDHRRALLGGGKRLRGGSDTEVLLELIARDGPERAVNNVDAMFALALWDRRERTLLLARDRIGEKPLVYGRHGGRLVFASDLSTFEALPGPALAMDAGALADYVRYGFIPAPRTVYAQFSKVPPGCVVRVHPDGTIDPPRRYWSLTGAAAAGIDSRQDAGADEVIVDDFEDVLSRSVGRRLVADVPVGAFLSGGIDSSLVVALAQIGSAQPIRTFTVAVGGDGDESSQSRDVARHLGTDHITLPLREVDALALACRMGDVYDEPFADPSGIPTAMLCAATRSHVTVALSGDGGDELFAGYNRYRVGRARGVGLFLSPPAMIRRPLAGLLAAVRPEIWDTVTRRRVPAAADKAHKLSGALRANGRLEAYRCLSTVWEPDQVLTNESTRTDGSGTPALGSPLDQMMLQDQAVALPDDMLVKLDRASMAVGLEARVPFLAPEMVELSWRLPNRAKMRGTTGKWVVRQALRRHVPPALWDRPKMGFDPPLARWLRGPLREWADDLLAPSRLRRQGVLDVGVVSQVWREHLDGRRNHDYRLWALLMLESWMASKSVVSVARETSG